MDHCLKNHRVLKVDLVHHKTRPQWPLISKHFSSYIVQSSKGISVKVSSFPVDAFFPKLIAPVCASQNLGDCSKAAIDEVVQAGILWNQIHNVASRSSGSRWQDSQKKRFPPPKRFLPSRLQLACTQNDERKEIACLYSPCLCDSAQWKPCDWRQPRTSIEGQKTQKNCSKKGFSAKWIHHLAKCDVDQITLWRRQIVAFVSTLAYSAWLLYLPLFHPLWPIDCVRFWHFGGSNNVAFHCGRRSLAPFLDFANMLTWSSLTSQVSRYTLHLLQGWHSSTTTPDVIASISSERHKRWVSTWQAAKRTSKTGAQSGNKGKTHI